MQEDSTTSSHLFDILEIGVGRRVPSLSLEEACCVLKLVEEIFRHLQDKATARFLPERTLLVPLLNRVIQLVHNLDWLPGSKVSPLKYMPGEGHGNGEDFTTHPPRHTVHDIVDVVLSLKRHLSVFKATSSEFSRYEYLPTGARFPKKGSFRLCSVDECKQKQMENRSQEHVTAPAGPNICSLRKVHYCGVL